MSARGVLLRVALVAGAALLAAAAARELLQPAVSGALAGAAVAALGVGVEIAARRARIDRLVWGTIGGVIGLLAGRVLSSAVAEIIPTSDAVLVAALGPLVAAVLGAVVGVRRGPDVGGVNAALFPRPSAGGTVKLLDTSAIIDGRIGDLAATGVIDGPLVLPQFVLRELQQIADSTDARKRARGKRGFDVVQRLQRVPGLVEIDAVDVPGVSDVDGKLVEIARARGARIVTTDYNLNRLAELRGVGVLNVNDVANALKSAAVAGDAMHVQVLREGKEAGQGVGYLDDGTMIVVEQGKRFIGQGVDVVVTSVLQTPSGRIVFTRLRDEDATRA